MTQADPVTTGLLHSSMCCCVLSMTSFLTATVPQLLLVLCRQILLLCVDHLPDSQPHDVCPPPLQCPLTTLGHYLACTWCTSLQQPVLQILAAAENTYPGDGQAELFATIWRGVFAVLQILWSDGGVRNA